MEKILKISIELKIPRNIRIEVLEIVRNSLRDKQQRYRVINRGSNEVSFIPANNINSTLQKDEDGVTLLTHFCMEEDKEKGLAVLNLLLRGKILGQIKQGIALAKTFDIEYEDVIQCKDTIRGQYQ